MPRTRKVGLSEQQKHLTRCLYELVLRDPLVHTFLNFPDFDKLYSDNLQIRAKAELEYVRHRHKIASKWHVNVLPMPPPYEQIPEELRDTTLESLVRRQPWGLSEYRQYRDLLFPKGVRPTQVMMEKPYDFLGYTFNRGCVGPRLVQQWLPIALSGAVKNFWYRRDEPSPKLFRDELGKGGDHIDPCFAYFGLPLDQIHTVNIEVNLASITGRNLQDVASEVKKIISTALSYAAPWYGELDFLRTISPKVFDRAIAAYDLHMREGLTFSEIARRKRWSPDRVEKNVKRIYRAIHRKGYTARRRRIDTPAEGIKLYHCDKHAPKECPEGCEYMNDWLTKFNRTSPTDTTGSGRRPR